MAFLCLLPGVVLPTTGFGQHTKVDLLADVASIRPGTDFWLGVRMKMDPGWHTYWKYSGEAGLPTRITWDLPPGLTAGEIHWPAPHKYTEGGEVITFGYADETLLLVPVSVAHNVEPGRDVTIKAKVDWLECERVCIPGDASVQLTLPISTTPLSSTNTALFGRYRKQLPAKASAVTDVSISAEAKGRGIAVVIRPSPNRVLKVVLDELPDFYPDPPEEFLVGRSRVDATGSQATITTGMSLVEKAGEPLIMRGLVIYQLDDGERTAVEVEIPLGKEFLSKLPVGVEPGQSSSVLDQEFSSRPDGTESVALYLLFAVIGGLLLNIMPCVLPVIALKIFGLVKLGGDSPGRIRMLGISFSLGILASFLLLALVIIIIQAAGESVGWGFQFQEPLFVIVMSVIVFAFGLSLFGVYEITLSSKVVEGVGSVVAKGESREGYVSSFGEGVFATVLATPCTAPFLGTALGFAFSQTWWMILLIFSSVAFGMALPYLILTMKPAWKKFLPRPGEWMVTAKQFMGFLMMATLLWLLYVLGQQLGMEAIVWTSAFLLVIGVGCWMIGRFATLQASRTRVMLVWSTALVLTGLGYVVFITPLLEARDAISQTGSAGAPAAQGEIPWEPFSIARLDEHLNNKRAVFLDFTADWCLTCKVNEKTVLTDRDVVEKFHETNVVAMKADWTNRNPEITALLAKFGRSGVPFYVVFRAGNAADPIVLPEVITSGMVIDALVEASRDPLAGFLR